VCTSTIRRSRTRVDNKNYYYYHHHHYYTNKETQLGSSTPSSRSNSSNRRSNVVVVGGDDGGGEDSDDRICAAVLVPGFLTGAADFESMCRALTEKGLPTVCIGMPNWHWLPCLGGRSARPILERIDFTVKHLIANDGDISTIPPYEYNILDTWRDFQNNPGGVMEVGGSSRVEDYPIVEPQGHFVLPETIPKKKVALIGHRYDVCLDVLFFVVTCVVGTWAI
jgi:hypothetical protein